MTLNALLILSSATLRRPSQIRFNLTSVLQSKSRFSGTLYIEIWKPGNVHAPAGVNPLYGNFRQWSQASKTIYSLATTSAPYMDVRFIVKNSVPIDSPTLTQPALVTKKLVDLVFVDGQLKSLEGEIKDFVGHGIRNKGSNVSIQFLSPNCAQEDAEEAKDDGIDHSRKYSLIALGGTFDRIHNGHKILLTETVLKCDAEMIVGIADGIMTKSKTLHELMEPYSVREQIVREFLEDVSPPLNFRIFPLHDPFGPTVSEKEVEAIVVSQETLRGADKINQLRGEKGFPPLDVYTIDLVVESSKQSEIEEDKVSSSSRRLRTLGERLRPSLREPSQPYIIGLTGGSCSGKSTICDYLTSLNIASIDCDKLGHEAYKSGTECFQKLVNTFGEEILNDTKTEVNRRVLGQKVFGQPEELKKLTDIVWPEIRRLANKQIMALMTKGHKIIVLDAAVLLDAEWDDMCHEVWVAFVSREEAISRIEARDKVPRENAEKRIDSQLSNQERLSRATFAFCSLWEKEFTRKQVDKALNDVKSVLSKAYPTNPKPSLVPFQK